MCSSTTTLGINRRQYTSGWSGWPSPEVCGNDTFALQAAVQLSPLRSCLAFFKMQLVKYSARFLLCLTKCLDA